MQARLGGAARRHASHAGVANWQGALASRTCAPLHDRVLQYLQQHGSTTKHASGEACHYPKTVRCRQILLLHGSPCCHRPGTGQQALAALETSSLFHAPVRGTCPQP